MTENNGVRQDGGSFGREAVAQRASSPSAEELRGEIVVVVGGAGVREVAPEDAVAQVLALVADGIRLKDAAGEVAPLMLVGATLLALGLWCLRRALRPLAVAADAANRLAQGDWSAVKALPDSSSA